MDPYQEFEWTASDKEDDEAAEKRYRDQSEALAVALIVNRQAVLRLSAFAEHASDHERIAACRRAFRSAARHVDGAKVRTLMLRDDAGDPVAVLGYIDQPATDEELRDAMKRFKF
jgi:hypothetical protein